MLTLYDRLYGQIQLPDSARRLALTCPLLLRLREIRMPNIGFATYPSFASVTRYEHSVGVGHLAWWWARRNRVVDEEAEALSIAGLYHDGATPAFSHLFEEFLRREGFNHEVELAELLEGKVNMLGGPNAQVFLGRRCKIQEVLADPAGPNSLLSPWGVADLAIGGHPLGRVLHGQVDLDNIDNVIRAVTAMGLTNSTNELVRPYEVAAALVWEEGELRLEPAGLPAVRRWQDLRRKLYAAILDSEFEFRVQTTIKWALEELAASEEGVTRASWTLTEPELVDRLHKVPKAGYLLDLTRLNRPPDILFSSWVEDLTPLLGDESDQVLRSLRSELEELFGQDLYVNFYVDKRERSIDLPRSQAATLFDLELPTDHEGPRKGGSSGAIPGIVGAVGRPRKGYDSEIRYVPRKHPIGLDSAALVLKKHLGDDPVVTSATWLGSRTRAGSIENR